MRASTEEFLYELWFIAESTLRPSWRYLGSSDFEAWAWRKGLHRRLADLAKQKLIEDAGPRRTTSERLVRLTAAGRCAALGGRDPEVEWARGWDGRWRMLLFDLPIDEPVLRRRLNRKLRELRFGCLQGSAWLTPHAVDRLRHWVDGMAIDPENFLLIEGRPASGESDADLVAGAWNFAEINRRYERYLDILRSAPKPGCDEGNPRPRIREWLHRERAAWRQALALDPLLPGSLLPKDYRGRVAWNAQREEVPALISLLI